MTNCFTRYDMWQRGFTLINGFKTHLSSVHIAFNLGAGCRHCEETISLSSAIKLLQRGEKNPENMFWCQHNSAAVYSHRDPVCDEETVSEGLSGQHEEQRGDPRAAGHLRRGGWRRDGHQRVRADAHVWLPSAIVHQMHQKKEKKRGCPFSRTSSVWTEQAATLAVSG